jgi:hypothetical protein
MMIPNKKKKKVYEPPMVKEIGGVFEQAMGLSCVMGTVFSDCPGGTSFGATCPGGPAPTLGCPGGSPDRPTICRRGPGGGF